MNENEETWGKLLAIALLIIVIGWCNSNNRHSIEIPEVKFEKEILAIVEDSIRTLQRTHNKLNQNNKKEGLWIARINLDEYGKPYSRDVLFYRIINFKDGVVSEPIVELYANGVKGWEGYINDNNVWEGLCSWFDTTGKLIYTSTYKNGNKNGEEIEYMDDRVISKQYYKNGKLDGLHTKFYLNGAVHTSINYKANERNGVLTEYYSSNKVAIKARYLYGKLSGSYYEYYESGKLRSTGKYYNNEKVGNWIYYDVNGGYKKTEFIDVRVGAICMDGWRSSSTGRGTCSHHGGVDYWLVRKTEVIIERGH